MYQSIGTASGQVNQRKGSNSQTQKRHSAEGEEKTEESFREKTGSSRHLEGKKSHHNLFMQSVSSS